MAFNTLHIFGYGETQVISDTENKKVALVSILMTKLLWIGRLQMIELVSRVCIMNSEYGQSRMLRKVVSDLIEIRSRLTLKNCMANILQMVRAGRVSDSRLTVNLWMTKINLLGLL